MSKHTPITKIIIGLFVIVVVGFIIGSLYSSLNSTEEAVTTTDTSAEREVVNASDNRDSTRVSAEGALEAPGEVSASDPAKAPDSPEETEDTKNETSSDVVVAAASGTYTEYDPTLLSNAASGEVVLFFHASWCPSCRSLDKSINENMRDLPANVTILQIDYDSATELKKKYGVVRQHTLVRVDSEGNQIETLTGLTNTLDQVLAQL